VAQVFLALSSASGFDLRRLANALATRNQKRIVGLAGLAACPGRADHESDDRASACGCASAAVAIEAAVAAALVRLSSAASTISRSSIGWVPAQSSRRRPRRCVIFLAEQFQTCRNSCWPWFFERRTRLAASQGLPGGGNPPGYGIGAASQAGRQRRLWLLRLWLLGWWCGVLGGGGGCGCFLLGVAGLAMGCLGSGGSGWQQVSPP